MLGLEVELLLIIAQVTWRLERPLEARQALQEARQLAERCHLQQPLSALQRQLPKLFAAVEQEPATSRGNNPLSQREMAVLQLIAQGNSNLQIAERLFISLHTVKTHARRINGKLAVERRTQAVAKAKALGFFA